MKKEKENYMFDRPHLPNATQLIEMFDSAAAQIAAVDPKTNGNIVCRHMIADNFEGRGYSREEAELIAIHIETQVPDQMFDFTDPEDGAATKELADKLIDKFCDLVESVIKMMRSEFPTAPVAPIVSGMALQLA